MNDIGASLSPAVANGTADMAVGFIGLGRMGHAMATNLVAAGYQVVGLVRTPARAAELAPLGIETVTAIERVLDCKVVITMLPDDAAVREVVFGRQPDTTGLATGLAPDAVHLSMSTISPGCSAELAAEHARRGNGYVAAPVFGNPDAARARELFIIAAGAPDHFGRCQLVLDTLGQRTFFVGSDPAAANLIKLAGNAITAATLEIIGEVVALARKRGVDPELLITVLTNTMFGGRVHRIYGEKIAAQRYAAGGFVLPLALKDIRLALAEAEAAAVPMPTLSVVRDRLITGIAHGYAGFDWTALGLLAAEAAGLGPAQPEPLVPTHD
jgi:3-hydroxyisobutyrate dehydrogenase-like beta-hydroxyacid dehydrogenase